jgi:GDP-4-dehydro-6-deoxy-D-mannose reductase
LKILVTGASGFVGGWLRGELEAAGHEVLDGEEGGHRWLDVTDRDLVAARLGELRPDGMVHLAGVAFSGDATADPAQAFEVNVGGTLNLCEAIRRQGDPVAVLVAGSSEVYGSPAPADLPLTEASAVAPVAIYGLSKAAQESVALAVAARCGMRLVVTRSFNHSGPGQRAEFVLPALARRVALVRAGLATSVPVGNLAVRRDFTDVRDVVRAYRLLLEALVAGRVPAGGAVFNVCSGRTLAIGDAVAGLCRLAGVDAPIEVDPRLVRPNDPPEIRGDPSALEAATGWRPVIGLDTMIADIWADAVRAVGAPVRGGAGV